ncbi:hypothetical protein EON81_09530 [bacterium]|nr:MAG: hypothetical protein EON81_09530 [bacterium]
MGRVAVALTFAIAAFVSIRMLEGISMMVQGYRFELSLVLPVRMLAIFFLAGSVFAVFTRNLNPWMRIMMGTGLFIVVESLPIILEVPKIQGGLRIAEWALLVVIWTLTGFVASLVAIKVANAFDPINLEAKLP